MLRTVKTILTIAAILAAGALMAHNAEAKTPPKPPQVSAKSLALPVACASEFAAQQTRACHVGLAPIKGKKSRNIGTPQLDGSPQVASNLPAKYYEISQPKPQASPKAPNYSDSNIYCLVICTNGK